MRRDARFLMSAVLLVSIATLGLPTFGSAEPGRAGRGGPGASSRVVGIVVKLQDDPVASYQGTRPGLAATSPPAPGAARVGRGGPAVQAYRAHLAQKHAAFEAAARAAIPS